MSLSVHSSSSCTRSPQYYPETLVSVDRPSISEVRSVGVVVLGDDRSLCGEPMTYEIEQNVRAYVP